MKTDRRLVAETGDPRGDPEVANLEEMLLGVEVYEGVATLVGFVSHEEKRVAALEAAKRVPGVCEVLDDIHITLTGD